MLETTENINLSNIINTLGVTFISIDDSPITFPNLEMVSVFESY